MDLSDSGVPPGTEGPARGKAGRDGRSRPVGASSDRRKIATCGLYLVGAELARRGFVVSPASRGDSLQVAIRDSAVRFLVSVSTKTGRDPAWRLRECCHDPQAVRCVHVFVDIGTAGDGELFAVPGAEIAALAASPGSDGGRIRRAALRRYGGRGAGRAFAAEP